MSESHKLTISGKEIIEKRARLISPSVNSFTGYGKPFILSHAQGPYIWDENGKKYIDCLAQNLSVGLGHCYPPVVKAVQEQAEISFHCSTMYHNEQPALYAEELLAKFPKEEDWVVHFVNSGAEANDLAMMMARLYTGNYDLISLRNSFHGLHFGAMTMTGVSNCKQPLPSTPGILHVHNPDQYQGIFGEGAGIDPYLKDLKTTISTSTHGAVAGIIIEPIQGYAGIIPMPEGYMSQAFDIIREAGGVCIVDEVQTGFGRTGSHYWGFEAHDVTPDIVVLAKAIGNGFPLAAVVCKRPIAESMAKKKFFNTYGSNPMACAAGRAVIKAIDDENLVEHTRALGEVLHKGFHSLKDEFSFIGDVRGSGLMVGMEFVTDHETKTPDLARGMKVGDALLAKGVIASKSGAHGNVIRINPPMSVSREDIEFVLKALHESLAESES
jgi:alanine-glyoxylate transaminase/(R)-3-amino-2-methylpropionate-pyruvate transaminase